MERLNKHISRRNFLGLAALVLAGTACAGTKSPNPEIPSLSSTEIPSKQPSKIVPTGTLTPEPSPTPDTRGYFEIYLYPALLTVAEKRRNEKAEKDPDFWHRVDKELNTQRINFDLLGFGSESKVGARNTDSIQLMSLDLKRNELRIISIKRDTWAPEIEREKGNNIPRRINGAFLFGGMPLAEKVLEDATGLSSDFVLGMEMEVLSRAVKEVFGNKLEVCIPWTIDDVAMGYFKKGLQTLDGEDILRIARARQFTGGSTSSRSFMQQLILRSMMGRAKTELSSGVLKATGFITKSLVFFEKENREGNIVTNFDIKLFLDLGFELGKKVIEEGVGENNGFGMPEFTARYEIETEPALDPYDVTRHKPIGGNPYAEDLVTGYWTSARQEVKTFLTSPADKTGFEAGETCTTE